MATLNFLRCTDNEFLAKHRTAVLLDDVAARRHRFAAGGDSNIVACSCNLSESGSDRAQLRLQGGEEGQDFRALGVPPF